MDNGSGDKAVTKQDLNEALQQLKSYVDERSERIETKLLTAFHSCARTMEIRVRSNDTRVGVMDERLALLEERVGRIEQSQ